MTSKTASKLHQQTLRRVYWSAASTSVRMCHKLVIQERIRRLILNECFGHKNFNFWTFGGKLRQRTRRVPDVISPQFAPISCTWQKQSEKKLHQRLKLIRGENAVFSSRAALRYRIWCFRIVPQPCVVFGGYYVVYLGHTAVMQIVEAISLRPSLIASIISYPKSVILGWNLFIFWIRDYGWRLL